MCQDIFIPKFGRKKKKKISANGQIKFDNLVYIGS